MDTLIIYKKGFTGYNEEKVNNLVETRICFTRRRSMVRVHLSPPVESLDTQSAFQGFFFIFRYFAVWIGGSL